MQPHGMKIIALCQFISKNFAFAKARVKIDISVWRRLPVE
jgi:hypothetical protein